MSEHQDELKIDPATAELIYNETRSTFERLYYIADGLDTKTSHVLAIASVVIGLQAAADVTSSGPGVLALTIAAGAAYAVAAAACVRGLWTRKYVPFTNDDWLWQWKLADLTDLHEQAVAGAHLHGNIDHNRRLNAGKARLLRIALSALSIETVLVAAALAARIA